MHKFNNVFVGICKFFSMSHQWREGIRDQQPLMYKDYVSCAASMQHTQVSVRSS